MTVFRKEDLEGYLMIDHRESPGLTLEQSRAAGGPALPVGKGSFFQSATYNCSHCSALIVKNPLRTRERGYCPKCDRYVCDWCEAERVRSGGACRPFSKVIDEFLETAAKQKG